MSVPGRSPAPVPLVVELNLDVGEAFVDEVDEDLLVQVVRRALEAEGVVGEVEVGLTVTDDAEIRELNCDYRGIDAPTDVLSFSQVDALPGASEAFPTPPGQARLLGDVIISGDRARSQAEDYGHSRRRELAYLAVHGVLHLMGYDHETEADRQTMRLAEEAALESVPRHGPDGWPAP